MEVQRRYSAIGLGNLRLRGRAKEIEFLAVERWGVYS
jgi:hypothetical protein